MSGTHNDGSTAGCGALRPALCDAAAWRRLWALPLAAALANCAGIDAATNHAGLDVHTHMSESVFLDPVAPRQRTVYIGMRNTSDYPGIDVRGPLTEALQQRGYTVVSDPAAAHYLLQGNVLQAGKLAHGQEQALLGAGYGQPLLAGLTAGGLTGGFGGNRGTALGVGVGVAALTTLVNYAYQDVTYAVTVDIQLAERPGHGGKVRQRTQSHRGAANSSASSAVTDSTAQSFGMSAASSQNSNDLLQTIDEDSDFKKYNVRDIAYADQVNLRIEQAVPTLVQHLASSFANLFE